MGLPSILARSGTLLTFAIGLVYCFTRKDAEQVCQELCRLGIKAGCYHADFQASERTRVHKEWLNDTIQVLGEHR